MIEAAGKSGSVDMFLNFMIMDINRNALRKRMEKSLQSKVDQFTRLVGDESWKEAGYRKVETLFGEDSRKYRMRSSQSGSASVKHEGGVQACAETDADEDEEQRGDLLPLFRVAEACRY